MLKALKYREAGASALCVYSLGARRINLGYKRQSRQPVAPGGRIMLDAAIGSDSGRGRCVYSIEQAP